MEALLKDVGMWFLGLSIIDIGKVVLVLLGLRLVTGFVVKTKSIKWPKFNSFIAYHGLMTTISLAGFFAALKFANWSDPNPLAILGILCAVWSLVNVAILVASGYYRFM